MNGKILVELQDHMGSDAAIANAGWSSTYDKDKREDKYDDPAKVTEFVQRLIRSGHSVPVESVIFRFWIRHPIFNDRQHMTHRIASHNGLSGRYRTMPEDWFSVPKDCRDILSKINYGFGDKVANEYDQHCQQANDLYRGWLKELKAAEKAMIITNDEYKRVREILRAALPTAGMVERTTILNLRSFANYQRLRGKDSHAQAEIKSVAVQMLDQVEAANICPVAIATLKEKGWVV